MGLDRRVIDVLVVAEISSTAALNSGSTVNVEACTDGDDNDPEELEADSLSPDTVVGCATKSACESPFADAGLTEGLERAWLWVSTSVLRSSSVLFSDVGSATAEVGIDGDEDDASAPLLDLGLVSAEG